MPRRTDCFDKHLDVIELAHREAMLALTDSERKLVNAGCPIHLRDQMGARALPESAAVAYDKNVWWDTTLAAVLSFRTQLAASILAARLLAG